MEKSSTKVLILGAGYAGVMAAVRLAGRAARRNAALTLVNAVDPFVERPRLHELAVGAPLREKPVVLQCATNLPGSLMGRGSFSIQNFRFDGST